MLNPTRLGGTLLLSGGLLLGLSSCRASNPKAIVSTPEIVEAPVTNRPAARTIAASPSADSYSLAIDKADSAVTISQSAQSQDDWNLVVSRWQQAVQLMKSVPTNSPRHAQAKTKIAEFERNLSSARQQVTRIGSKPPVDLGSTIDDPASPYTFVPSNPPSSASRASGTNVPGQVYQARIKRREGGTPVIDVTFNGSQTFEMIVDTGASGTVITEQMAVALKVQVIGKAKVSTASDRSVEVPLANVDSIAVGGASVRQVTVAIGRSLDVGLLGHDFFDGFDVTIKRDVVEFRPQRY